MRQNEFDYIEEALREVNRRMSHVDTFMGEMKEAQRNRLDATQDLNKKMDELSRKLEENDKRVEGLLTKINKWEAKLGAFVFIAGCLWAFLIAMKEQILAFVKG